MPFRQNAFRDQIAQPGTEYAEIDTMIIDRHGLFAADLWGADLCAEPDEDYKFGGTLMFSAEDEDTVDEDNPEPEMRDIQVEFDGFETKQEAIDWLVKLGLSPRQINEVN